MNAQTIADKLEAKSSGPDSWMAKCPAHEDHKPSLSIKSTGDKVLLKCFAGCTTDAVCAALGITVKDLFNKPATAPAQKKIVATYDYTDEAGALLYQVVRFDPKDFRQRKPDGKNGWDWKIGDTRRVLFRLPDVVNAIERDATIFICEGEKDCLALAGIGLCASCNAGGAESSPTGKKWLPDYTAALSGASVVILPDRDAPGRLHAQIVATHLHGVAASVRIVELPDINGRTVKDAADFVAAGGTAEDIARLLEGVAEFAPADLEMPAEDASPVARDADPVDPEIVMEHGAPYFTGGKLATVQSLGEGYWASAYAKSTRVLFDPLERAFFSYDPETGLWGKRTTDDIAKGLRAILLAHSRRVPDIGLEKHIKHAGLVGVIAALRGLVQREDAFSDPPRGIHVANGYLELGEDGTHHLREFSPEDYSRNQSPIAYDPEATCPRFLNELLRPAIPEEDTGLLQRWTGIALCGHNFAQRFLILDGIGGRGKGTFCLLVQGLLGKRNCTELRPAHLGSRFETKRFLGRSLLFGNDVNPKFISQKGGELLKPLCGGDTFSLETKGNEQEFHVQGNFSMIITANTRLKVRLEGDIQAWRRRLLIVRYEAPPPTVVIADFEQILLREEGPGILNWALEGLALARREGYALTPNQRQRIEDLLASSDSLRQFITEKLEPHDASDVSTAEFHAAYGDFCAENGWDPSPQADRDAGGLILDIWKQAKCHCVSRHGSQVRGWMGLRLVDGQVSDWNT